MVASQQLSVSNNIPNLAIVYVLPHRHQTAAISQLMYDTASHLLVSILINATEYQHQTLAETVADT